MPTVRVAGLVVAVALALALALTATASAASRGATVPKVPSGFVGVNVDGPLASGATGQPSLPKAMSTMVSSGVESIRVAFNWAAAQPTAGGPYDFSATDTIVAGAARDGMTVLPVVLYTPSWDARSNPPGTLAIPRDDGPYAAYLTALVKRYGPRGTFWSANPGLPKRPIREWQVWNEPNFTYYWPTRPFAPSYVALLRAAHTAVHKADPGAKIVLAGMPNDAWEYLQKIYNVRGAAGAFDVASVHPYTLKPSNVIVFLQKMRQVMKRNGDARKPLVVTEMGWNSSIGHRPSDTDCCQSTAARQAAKVKQVLPMLAANRAALRLQAFYYYTWASHGVNGGPSDNWAGIFQVSGSKLVAKPVFSVFKSGVLALERCKRIGKLAGSCAVRAR
jgi:polysaccharide biosynthesis protein PslG